MTAPVLSVRNLTVRIGNIAAGAWHSASTSDAGEVLGIVGESGSGKSLTLRAILRLLPRVAQTSGDILWRGRDLTRLPEPEIRALRGGEIAIVFQEPMTALDPVLTDRTADHRKPGGASAACAAGRARARRSNCWTWSASPTHGGAFRVTRTNSPAACGSARCSPLRLPPDPKLLLADEPTTALDVTIQDQILQAAASPARRTVDERRPGHPRSWDRRGHLRPGGGAV